MRTAPPLTWCTSAHFFAAFDDSHGRTGQRRVWTRTALTPLSMGIWQRSSMGHWTSRGMKTAAVSGRSMPLQRWRLGGTLLSICCVQRTHTR